MDTTSFISVIVLSFLFGGSVSHAETVKSVIESNCIECHDASERSGDVDLTMLFSENPDVAKSKALWIRVEKAVASQKMPPADESHLSDEDRIAILHHFRDQFVLRDGKDHIGVTPLRRLTRYELENTLEDLLSVKLKRPYVVSLEAEGFLPSTIEQLYPADTPGESGFDNDAVQLRNVKLPMLKYIDCLDYALRIFDQNDEAREVVLGIPDKPDELSEERARQILTHFLDRSARGYQNNEDRELVFAAWETAAKKDTAYRALLQAMKVALLSPSFVYRLEATRDSADAYQISAKELAVRLSYFLWSSMPDNELFQATENDALLQEEVLKAQIQRMLNSPKRIALSENFAGQWLGFDELRRNPAFYEGERWTRGAYDELLFAFDELIKSDRSLLEIVDSDWIYLRLLDPKARGVEVKRHEFESVYADIFAQRRSRTGLNVELFYNPPLLYKVESDRVGGMLTSAGIMRLTSAPKRTSPIRRGVWVLEKIIGEKMHPPENIPPLAESEKKLAAKQVTTPADILKLHTSQQSCRVCHQHIDPLGLGLENFSPTGDWRTEYNDKTSISSSGVLPNGHAFATPKELKTELLAFYKDRITENIIHNMLAYAIGRKLEPFDRVTVEQIKQELIENDYRMGVLIEQIILSKQFRYRQDKL